MYSIRGTKGIIEIHQRADAKEIAVTLAINGESRLFITDRITPFRLQAEHFAETIHKGELLRDDGEEIVAQARAMDTLIASGFRHNEK